MVLIQETSDSVEETKGARPLPSHFLLPGVYYHFFVTYRTKAFLLGTATHPSPPTFPAGAPPLIVELTTLRIKGVCQGQPPSPALMQPLLNVFPAAPPLQPYR
jgi:hypothetical protein